MNVGVRVVRGPDWQWGDQDGGKGHIGTVVRPRGMTGGRVAFSGTVFVRWDSGKMANYRTGNDEGCHDLKIFSSANAGS